MNLSEKTFNLLKNFSSINQSILFKKGNTLRTMSVMKNILAEADIEEEFPRDFAIYDLVRFLNGISLYDEPEFDFANDSYVTIRAGKNHRTRYFFADPSVIVAPPEIFNGPKGDSQGPSELASLFILLIVSLSIAPD